MTWPRHGTQRVQLRNAPRSTVGGRDGRQDRRLRLHDLVWPGDGPRRFGRRTRRAITSASHRPSSEDSRTNCQPEIDLVLRTATNRGDCSFPAPGVAGARNEWSRTTAPSASVVVSHGGSVRKPPLRDHDLTVKSVVCVFGTTRRAEDDCQHLSADHTIQNPVPSHRGEPGSVALKGERPIRHRA